MNNYGAAGLVALGGAVGSVLRFATGLALPAVSSGGFPWPTFAVNVVGSLMIGLVFGVLAKQSIAPEPWRLLLATGFCGGFTTLSAMTNEGYLLLRQQQFTTFFLYFSTTILFSLLATALGYTITK